MRRAQRRQHDAAPEHVQETFRGPSPVYRYLVVGQKVDNKRVMMLRCTFCNKVFQGPGHETFQQTNYCKDVNDEALHIEIASMQAVETHPAELEEVRQPFWVTGATILSGGGKSRDGRPIVNFLVAGSRGVVMYMTINREGEPDDAVHVLQRWVTIFHDFRFGGPQRVNAICTDSTSADDDSDDERIPEAADDSAFPIPREIDKTHEDTKDVETRTYTARRAGNFDEMEMTGGDEDRWGPFGEVASTDDVRDERVGNTCTSRVEGS
ncbi:hypothetical protein CBR_g44289 [Chara braunii]|uniref:BED-type domain-containing protein n=1 Tax=Chara braunii TaxID=69332 RepID=A0A388K307_CHABU|nr:hypothetical protein CBR_g44289 [Chara braunii]|eukprot:GBG64405.1 hypothetical protein CBR_g44289 [Chara braunii]